MDYLQTLTRRRKKAHSQFLEMNSRVYKNYIELEETTYAEGALSSKIKELIAVGISAATNCESCIQWHTEYALKAGATPREILEALEVAMVFGGGRAIATARLALEVMQNVEKGDHESATY